MTDLARQANRLRIFGKQCIRDNEEFKRTPADKDSELFVLRMLYEQEWLPYLPTERILLRH